MIKDLIRYYIFNKKYFLDIHITDHCNLNCKSCAHFSSVSKERFININDLKAYYEILKPKFNKFFNSIHLLGGEPLLHPEIKNILSVTRKYFPDIEIQLVTNGIVLNTMDEDFFKILNKLEITIQITRYPISLDYQTIKEKCNSYGIKCNISELTNTFIHHYLDPQGRQEPASSRKKCKWGGKCIQLKAGKIYPCAQAAHSHILNEAFNLDFKDDRNNYIDISKLDSLTDFIKFINKPIPFCRYCDLEHEHYTDWALSKKKKDEWI